MGQFFILRSRVQQEYNGLLLNALNRTLKAICPWKPRLKWIPRSKPGASKSQPLWAAHTRIGNVWEYPPPRALHILRNHTSHGSE